MERGGCQLDLPARAGYITMTRRRDLEHHRKSLAEIRDIMNSMKTLAYMETRKLGRFLDAQQTVVEDIEQVASDLLSFHPDTLPVVQEATPVYVLIGTERGFCGDFNHALLTHLESSLEAYPTGSPMLIAIGRKLATLLEKDERVTALIDGASVVEEVTALLLDVVGELNTLQDKHGVLAVYCLYHTGDNGVVIQKLLPPFQGLPHKPSRLAYPPILNQSPREFLVELTDHYLFAALHQMLYTSLMAENRHRVAHLQGAVKHLDDDSAELARQCNTLRQEEIIEEIEVILLSAASLGENPDKRS
jgi:F-type H+-transporting ATPase subunit gamma